MEDLNEREERLRQEREAKEALGAKIKAMEGKLLSGGGDIVDHTNEQQRALEQRRHELAEQKVSKMHSLNYLSLLFISLLILIRLVPQKSMFLMQSSKLYDMISLFAY